MNGSPGESGNQILSRKILQRTYIASEGVFAPSFFGFGLDIAFLIYLSQKRDIKKVYTIQKKNLSFDIQLIEL